jgi:hypothetical protein
MKRYENSPFNEKHFAPSPMMILKTRSAIEETWRA